MSSRRRQLPSSSRSRNAAKISRNCLAVKVQPLFCYLCSQNFTSIKEFKSHQHESNENDGDQKESNYMDFVVKTECEEEEPEECDQDEVPEWPASKSLHNQFKEQVITTHSVVSTSPSKISSNSHRERQVLKCLNGADQIKILCYICSTQFTSLQKFNDHLTTPTSKESLESHSNIGKENHQSEANIPFSSSTFEIDDQIIPSPISFELDDDDDEDNDENYTQEDPLQLSSISENNTDCPHCPKTFRKSIHLAAHLRNFHTTETNSKIDFQHDKSENNNDSGSENYCEPSISSRRRKSSRKKDGDTICLNCKHNFHAPRDLQRHISKVKRVDKKCAACLQTFVWSCVVRAHQKSCDGLIIGANSVISSSSSSSIKKNNDKDEDTSTPKFPCSHDGCDKEFSIQSDLARHSLSHLKEKPFKCDFILPSSNSTCDRTFRNAGELAIHMNRHTGEIVYSCPEETCERSFREKRRLKDHLKAVHPSLLDIWHTLKFTSHGTVIMKEEAGRGVVTMETGEMSSLVQEESLLNEDSLSRTDLNDNENKSDEAKSDADWEPDEDSNSGSNFRAGSKSRSNSKSRSKRERSFKCRHPNCDRAFYTKQDCKRHFTCHLTEKPCKCTFVLEDSGEICGRTFRVISELKEHENKHTREIVYECPKPDCGKTYLERRLLRNHIKNHDKVRKRPGRQLTSNNRPSKRRKINIDPDLNSNSNSNSNSASSQSQLEGETARGDKKPRNFRCDQCDKSFYNRQGLDRHSTIHLSVKPFQCTFIMEQTGEPCGRSFRVSDELRSHENVHTKLERFDCPHEECKKVFYEKKGLRLHLKNIHPSPEEKEILLEKKKAMAAIEMEKRRYRERRFKCSHCDAAFYTMKSKDRHTTVHLPEKPFKCKFIVEETGVTCGRTFRVQSELTVHENVHTKEKIFKCPYSDLCPQLFFYEKTALRLHMKKKHAPIQEPGQQQGQGQSQSQGNEGEENLGENAASPFNSAFKCWTGDCNGKTFSGATALRNHKRVRHSERKPPGAICELCGKVLVCATSLRAHLQQVHERLRPHLCNYCGQGFFSKGVFQRHVRLHTGETPFHCKSCTAQFRFSYELNRHVAQVHTGENLRKYVCTWTDEAGQKCDKSFFTKPALERHLLVHTGEKPFQCPIVGCPVAFPDPRPLKNHIVNSHPEFPVDTLSKKNMSVRVTSKSS